MTVQEFAEAINREIEYPSTGIDIQSYDGGFHYVEFGYNRNGKKLVIRIGMNQQVIDLHEPLFSNAVHYIKEQLAKPVEQIPETKYIHYPDDY